MKSLPKLSNSVSSFIFKFKLNLGLRVILKDFVKKCKPLLFQHQIPFVNVQVLPNPNKTHAL